MDFNNPPADLQKKILDSVKKSGFPLEWEVRDCIRKAMSKLPSDLNDLGIDFHGDYLDHQENQHREFDISTSINYRSKDAPNLLWSQYFECKQSDKSWIFFTEPKEEYFQKSMWTASSVNLRYLGIIPSLYSKNPDNVLGGPIHYGRLSYQAYSFTSFPDNSEATIRTALYQVLKPMYHHFTKVSSNIINRKTPIDNDIFLWFPVIVYSGNMFEYRYSSDGGELFPSKHVLLETYLSLGNNNFPSTYLVDVVRADYLSEYLDQQYIDYKRLKDFIVNKKPDRRAISDVILYI